MLDILEILIRILQIILLSGLLMAFSLVPLTALYLAFRGLKDFVRDYEAKLDQKLADRHFKKMADYCVADAKFMMALYNTNKTTESHDDPSR
jgi:hypothetical protein